MKQINEYRDTNVFSISPGHVIKMAKIMEQLKGKTPVRIAHDERAHEESGYCRYIVRHFEEIDGRTALVDTVFEVYINAKQIEQKIIQHDIK